MLEQGIVDSRKSNRPQQSFIIFRTAYKGPDHNNPQAFSCFLYNAIYANFPSELFNSVVLVETVINALSGLIAPGYKALGCTVNFPDATGTGVSQYDAWSKTYVGDAKYKATGSGWYKSA